MTTTNGVFILLDDTPSNPENWEQGRFWGVGVQIQRPRLSGESLWPRFRQRTSLHPLLFKTGGKAGSLICKHDHLTPARKMRRDVRALKVRDHHERRFYPTGRHALKPRKLDANSQTRPLHANEGNQTTSKGTSPLPPRRVEAFEFLGTDSEATAF